MNKLRELIENSKSAPLGHVGPALRKRDWLEDHEKAIADLIDAAEKVCACHGSAACAVEQSGLREALAKLKD